MVDIALSRYDHDIAYREVVDAVSGETYYEYAEVEGQDQTAQELFLVLNTYLGEWFLDNRVGIPYFQDILIKSPRGNVVTTYLRNAILSVEGVISITTFDIDLNAERRVLTVNFECDTVAGPITDSYVLDLPRNRA